MAGPIPYKLVTPLGDTKLLFYRMRAIEALSDIGEFQIDCLSEDGKIDVDSILAQNVHVEVSLPGGAKRHFAGYVTRFAQAGMRGRFHVYQATVNPWTWFLTRTADCRIFQEKSVPDIIKEVFADHGTADFEDRLNGNYKPREYCVQYRETDFNFISRLMEEEGIYTFFEYNGNQNKLVLADALSAHSPFPGYASVPYVKPSTAGRYEKESIQNWRFEREVRTGKYVMTDYDFKKPGVKLEAKTLISRGHPIADYEVFDFPGEYLEKSDGEVYVKTRLDEIHSRYELMQGSTNARGVSVGSLLTLTDHPRGDQNKEYLITRVEHACQAEGFESDAQVGTTFDCVFVALSTEHTFRPERKTPRPIVKGPQTAVVVGPSGEEIYTDEYGRVKVQFFWDRRGQNNENSSCWMRVSHPWAGKNWGMIAIPRIGQEVIVECLEGDPDRPIITGRVYNANQMPPYDLPANKTQTGIKTRSSMGGGTSNFNEIRFEDKKGSEQLFIHAEKNQDIEVEADETHWVGHDRTKTIDHDETNHIKNNRTETVDVNEDITIGGNRTEQVGGNEDITIGGSRTEMVGGSETITIGGSRTETVGASETITIAASQTKNVGASVTETFGAMHTQTIGGAKTVTVGAALTQTVGAAMTVTVGGPITMTAAAPVTINAPTGCSINSPAQIVETTPMKIGFLGFGMEYNGMKMEYTGVGTAMKAVDYTMVAGLKMDSAGLVIENEPLKMDTIATQLKTNGLAFFLKNLFIVT